MTTSITRFQLPSGIPTEAVKNGFLAVAPKFKHPAGLLRKYFLISEDGKKLEHRLNSCRLQNRLTRRGRACVSLDVDEVRCHQQVNVKRDC